MCLGGSPKTPAVQHSPPPPMLLPAAESAETNRTKKIQRQRAAAEFGRESTILGSAGGPTGQAKTLLGS